MRRSGSRLGPLGGAGFFLVVLLLVLSSCTPAKRSVARPAAPPTAPPSEYVGAETCKGCHEGQFEQFSHTKMGRLFLKQPRNTVERQGCENCHGPGKAHVDAGGGRGVGGLITFAKNDPHPVEQRNAVCLQCHEKGDRLFWQGSPHESRDVACTNCHTAMTDVSPKNQLKKGPAASFAGGGGAAAQRSSVIETCGQCHIQRRAQTMRSSHMPLREGKMTCTDCHNPHGTVTPALLRENSTNETCYRCHTEKRGPFLWTHPPVQENCTNCHDPHGTNHEKMLRVPKPRLCQQCHVAAHATGPFARGTSLQFVLGRSCTDCHAVIHGSNHPSGSFFLR